MCSGVMFIPYSVYDAIMLFKSFVLIVSGLVGVSLWMYVFPDIGSNPVRVRVWRLVGINFSAM